MSKTKYVWWSIILVVIIFWTLAYMNTERQSVPTLSINYNPSRICDDAFTKGVYQASPRTDHFIITLHAGCFGQFITLPSSWHNYVMQPYHNDTNWWYSIWFQEASNPAGIFRANDKPNFAYHPSSFRLQGEEGAQILFSTTDVTPDISPPSATSSFTPKDYQKRFCDDNTAQPLEKLGEQFTIDLKPGCFAGEYIMPYNWRRLQADKSQKEGDWAAMWCSGQGHPTKVHPYYEDFDDVPSNCPKFYLEGKGSIHYTRLQ